jgi:hypothetical protein
MFILIGLYFTMFGKIKYCDLFFFSPFFVYTYNFVCMDDVIFEAESALCNINKNHLQLKSQNLITYKCIISVVISGEGIESA